MDNITIALIIGVLIIIAAVWYFIFRKKEGMFTTKPEFIYFYQPDCPFCQAMMPEWDILQAAFVDDPNINVHKISLAEFPRAMESRNTYLETVPALVLYPFGSSYNSLEVYHGERTAKAMSAWIIQTMEKIKMGSGDTKAIRVDLQ